MHIDHNALYSDLCRESMKRVLDDLELLKQKEPNKISSIKRHLLLRNNKVLKMTSLTPFECSFRPSSFR
jgi:hypothetical protein